MAISTNNNEKFRSFKSKENIHKKEVGPYRGFKHRSIDFHKICCKMLGFPTPFSEMKDLCERIPLKFHSKGPTISLVLGFIAKCCSQNHKKLCV